MTPTVAAWGPFTNGSAGRALVKSGMEGATTLLVTAVGRLGRLLLRGWEIGGIMEVADAIGVTFFIWEGFDFFFETCAGFFLFLVGTGSSISKQSAAMRLVTFAFLTYDERRFVLISCRGGLL